MKSILFSMKIIGTHVTMVMENAKVTLTPINSVLFAGSIMFYHDDKRGSSAFWMFQDLLEAILNPWY